MSIPSSQLDGIRSAPHEVRLRHHLRRQTKAPDPLYKKKKKLLTGEIESPALPYGARNLLVMEGKHVTTTPRKYMKTPKKHFYLKRNIIFLEKLRVGFIFQFID